MTFGQIIKQERLKRNLTCKDVSFYTGICKESIWNMENYKQSVGLKSLNKLCEFFNLDKRKMACLNFKQHKVTRDFKKYLKELSAIPGNIE